MKTRVIFVDDEERVLDGLRRSLRQINREWDMVFAKSGAEALEEIERGPADVVVTDMRMPGMDGAALIAEIEERSPGTIRFVLSGQSDEEAMVRLIGSSHQYLAKPCDPDTLVTAIRRALSLRTLLGGEALTRTVTGLKSVPTLPRIYAELLDELRSPRSSLKSIAEVVERDMGVTAKILRIANSAFFGLRHTISTPYQAVTMLGAEMLKGLVLTQGIVEQLRGAPSQERMLGQMWRRSQRCGAVARAIATAENLSREDVDQAFVAGLLHDVGAVLFAVRLAEKYDAILRIAPREDEARIAAEERVIGASHAAVGAYLIGLWGLPDSIVGAIAYHHDPGPHAGSEFDVLATLHVAQALVRAEGAGGDTKPAVPAVDLEYLDAIGMAERLPAWLAIAHKLGGHEAAA